VVFTRHVDEFPGLLYRVIAGRGRQTHGNHGMVKRHDVLECTRDKVPVLIKLFITQPKTIRIVRRHPEEDPTAVPCRKGRTRWC